MSKKVIRQIKALNRFTLRERMKDESEQDYSEYLNRKVIEYEKLMKVKSRYHASI